jgi:hypothetical protein
MLGPDDVIQHFTSANNASCSSSKLVLTMAIRKIIPNVDRGHIPFQTFETMHRTIYLAS